MFAREERRMLKRRGQVTGATYRVFVEICSEGSRLLRELSECKRALKFHRDRANAWSVLILMERSPRQWWESRSIWRGLTECVDEDRERSRLAVEALREHRTRLSRAIQIAAKAVSRCRGHVGDASAGLSADLRSLRACFKDSGTHDQESIVAYLHPGWSRHWLKILGIGLAAGTMCFFAFRFRTQLAGAILDARQALLNLWEARVREPVLDVWQTVRYNERKFQVASPNSLQLERESLARMVAAFLTKQRDFLSDVNAAQMDTLNTGDISSVMPYYEKEIQAPIYGALRGDLIELLLIQIQRAKSDVAMSLSAVDKLVSANEINFQVLSAIPAGLVLYWVGSFMYAYVTNRNPNGNASKTLRFHLGKALMTVGKYPALADPVGFAKFLLYVDRAFIISAELPENDCRAAQSVCATLVWTDNLENSPERVHSLIASLGLQSAALKM